MTTALTLVRPRLLPTLTIIVGALVAAYVALMVVTILLASLQTQLAQNVQTKQMAISKLESTYYASVTQLDATDPHALGYVTPAHVTYVSATQLPGFAFAQ